MLIEEQSAASRSTRRDWSETGASARAIRPASAAVRNISEPPSLGRRFAGSRLLDEEHFAVGRQRPEPVRDDALERIADLAKRVHGGGHLVAGGLGVFVRVVPTLVFEQLLQTVDADPAFVGEADEIVERALRFLRRRARRLDRGDARRADRDTCRRPAGCSGWPSTPSTALRC